MTTECSSFFFYVKNCTIWVIYVWRAQVLKSNTIQQIKSWFKQNLYILRNRFEIGFYKQIAIFYLNRFYELWNKPNKKLKSQWWNFYESIFADQLDFWEWLNFMEFFIFLTFIFKIIKYFLQKTSKNFWKIFQSYVKIFHHINKSLNYVM